jgi:beta,beta-carotene 9',10'-dioxygenase
MATLERSPFTAKRPELRRRGFESLDQETVIGSLPVAGEIPAWLSGSLLRTGPAKWEFGEKRLAHLIDGMAMLHRFSFARGEVSYASRFLQSKAYKAAESGRFDFYEFATDPCRRRFKRLQSLFAPNSTPTDNGNVNLTRLGSRFIAMTEAPLPIEFDP